MGKGLIKIIGDIGGQVNLVNIIAQVKALGEVDEYIVAINSPGGNVDAGYNISKYIKGLGKPITTIVDKECSSIATVPALSGDKGKRLVIEGSDVLIHAPWATAKGNASFHYMAAEALEVEEKKLAKFYQEHTGISIDGIEALMSVDTKMTAEMAVKSGFFDKVITEEEARSYGVIPTEKTGIQAFAMYDNKINTMNKDTQKPEWFKKLETQFSELKAAVVKAINPKALDVQTVDGNMVHVETEAEYPAVGDVVTKDGQPAPNETLTMTDGSVIKTDADSKVSEYTAAADAKAKADKEAADNKEIETLKTQLAEKEKELSDLKAAKAKHDKELKDINEKLVILGKSIKSEYVPDEEETKFRKVGNEKESEIEKKMKERQAQARKQK